MALAARGDVTVVTIGRHRILILIKALAKGVAVDAEGGGGFGMVILMTTNHVQDKSFLKLPDCLFKQDPVIDHLID